MPMCGDGKTLRSCWLFPIMITLKGIWQMESHLIFVLADVITNLMWTDIVSIMADVDALCCHDAEGIYIW